MNRILSLKSQFHHRLKAMLGRGKSNNLRMPIRAKITLPYFLLSVLMAVSASILVTNIVFDTVEERFRNQLREVGQLSSELMVNEEDRLLEIFRLLANSDGVPEVLLQNNPEELRILSFGQVVNGQIDAVEFLDPAGNPVLSMRHNVNSTVEDYAFSAGGDSHPYLEMDFVYKVLANQEDPLGDKFSGVARTEWGDYFYVSGPVYDAQDDFAGVLLLGTRLDSLTNSIRTKALGQITVYEFDGQTIASTFPSQPDALPQDLAQEVIRDQQLEKSKTRVIENQRDLTISNLAYTEVLLAWEVRGDVDVGILGAALSKNFFVDPNPYTRQQIIAVVAAAFLLVILIGIYLASLITRPLANLVLASEVVAGGNLDVHVDLRTNDELTILAKSFNQMVASLNESRLEILDAYDSALEGWTKALELRDKETEGHTQRVTEMTVAIAREFGFSGAELDNVRRGALLHDIGKMGVPDHILHKPAALSDDEWVIMKKHPLYAYEMLRQIRFLQAATDIPRYHHEHWDGGGYPYGLSGDEIPLASRIFSVVDCWDALTNDRPYRAKVSDEEALRIIEHSAGKLYDPEVTRAFRTFIEKSKAVSVASLVQN
jgi:putative nucleotidyltransferase with HDIG domain